MRGPFGAGADPVPSTARTDADNKVMQETSSIIILRKNVSDSAAPSLALGRPLCQRIQTFVSGLGSQTADACHVSTSHTTQMPAPLSCRSVCGEGRSWARGKGPQVAEFAPVCAEMGGPKRLGRGGRLQARQNCADSTLGPHVRGMNLVPSPRHVSITAACPAAKNASAALEGTRR